jgi:hypothetical protein
MSHFSTVARGADDDNGRHILTFSGGKISRTAKYFCQTSRVGVFARPWHRRNAMNDIATVRRIVPRNVYHQYI